MRNPNLQSELTNSFTQRRNLSIYIHTSVDLSLYSDIVSGHIARRSDLKLTDSMFCLCIFSSIFSIDGRS